MIMASGSGEVAAVPPSGAANGLSNGAGGTSAQTNNPLSRKLHKILETRLDNDKVPRAERGLGAAPVPHPVSLLAAEGTPDPRSPLFCLPGEGATGTRGAPGTAGRFPGCCSY